MTSTLEAPSRMGRRSQATELLRDLPNDLSDGTVEILFTADAYPTTSFVDEIVRTILCDRHARRLVFKNANPRVAEVAEQSASDLGVRNRLTLRRSG